MSEEVALKEGDTRVICKWLVLPRVLNNEVRWLERAKFKQRVMRLSDLSPVGVHSPGQTFLKWVSVEWA